MEPGLQATRSSGNTSGHATRSLEQVPPPTHIDHTDPEKVPDRSSIQFSEEHVNFTIKKEAAATHFPFEGAAGQQRFFPRRLKETSAQPRNFKRGLRNPLTIEKRKIKRSEKRRLARQVVSKGTADALRGRDARAIKLSNSKLPHGGTLKVATLNIQGVMKAGLRRQVEIWMKERGVKILLLQETKSKFDSKEVRKDYTWHFSGDRHTSQTQVFEAGVAIVVHNSILKHVVDVIPWSDRIISITLQASMPLTFISAYAFPARRKQGEDTAAEQREKQQKDQEIFYTSL